MNKLAHIPKLIDEETAPDKMKKVISFVVKINNFIYIAEDNGSYGLTDIVDWITYRMPARIPSSYGNFNFSHYLKIEISPGKIHYFISRDQEEWTKVGEEITSSWPPGQIIELIHGLLFRKNYLSSVEYL